MRWRFFGLGRVTLLTAMALGCPGQPPSGGEADPWAGEDAGALVMGGMPACDAPSVVLQPGTQTPSGLVRCANGLVERVQSEPIVGADFGATACTQGDDIASVCGQHSDCAGLEVCAYEIDPERQCSCTATCRTDDDCGTGYACLPPPFARDDVVGVRTHARCVRAECRTSADCEGGRCVLSLVREACSVVAVLACMDDAAACFVDSDCPRAEYGCETGRSVQGHCQPNAGSWSCAPSRSDCYGFDCE